MQATKTVLVDFVHQPFGSLDRKVLDTEEVSAEEALQRIAIHLWNDHGVMVEETDTGHDVVVSVSLTEEVVFHL